jgi:hypothetical protein
LCWIAEILAERRSGSSRFLFLLTRAAIRLERRIPNPNIEFILWQRGTNVKRLTSSLAFLPTKGISLGAVVFIYAASYNDFGVDVDVGEFTFA